MSVTVALLFKYTDGEYLFQRRTDDAPRCPDLLSFFGGHADPGEDLLQALAREAGEEVSIPFSDMEPQYIGAVFTSNDEPLEEDHTTHVYVVPISSLEFKVYEGKAAEKYSLEEVMKRTDIVPSLPKVLTELKEKL
jgi:8-oxo-dGTP pyrophosphatase MutT (NUDIX family)